MMSSASNPCFSIAGMLKALTTSLITGICGTRSSGICARLAL